MPAVYVFDLDGTNEVKINQMSSDTHDGGMYSATNEFGVYGNGGDTFDDDFGGSISISGGKIVIGARNEDIVATNNGAVFIYDIDGTNGKRLKNADYVSRRLDCSTIRRNNFLNRI